MTKELHSLVSKYKVACLELEEIHAKVETVNSSEQAIASHLSASTSTSTSTHSSSHTAARKDETDERLNQIISKLKVDVDTVLSKRLAETESTKSAVQSYIDNTVWSLFSRTELLNDTLLFNNDQKRIDDKKRLYKLISTLFELDQEQVESQDYRAQLHQWLIHISTIYLRLGGSIEKHKMLALLTTTSNIAPWAMPLIHIQADKMSQADDFLNTLDAIFIRPKAWTWTEDDFLVALDQLAIDFNYNRLVDSVDPDQQVSCETVLKFSQDLINKLMQAMHRSGEAMNSLVKRLAQTVVQISILLIDAIAEKGWECQDQVDDFMSQLIFGFYDLKDNGGWFFLPNIPFKALSIHALWLVTVRMLQLKDATTPPGSLNDVLDDHLPNITRFQYQLHGNQMQGYFMLNCLTNMATCIPSGVDEIGAINDPKSTLSACIVAVISYTLFTVAFVDKDLREVFYKDVRDNFGAICRCHPFVISLLFRWTAEHMAIMERMALYLFHSLKLDDWNILKDDLKLLHKLLSCVPEITSMTSQQKAQIQLAKYIIQHLNYGYKHGTVDSNLSKSQPWHSRKLPFLGYDTHEEVAFILLDACQQFQPLPDTTSTKENKGAIELVGTVTTAVSTYLPIADQIQLLKPTYDHTTSSNGNTANDFVNWAWSVAVQLKLYDCPVSPRASDIENSITLPFLKLVLNSYNSVSSSHSALLIYISFMLSVTSRHFLRFESNDGWMKLLVVLKKGKPEAVIRIFSEMIPSFVYMHGDDFFNDESLSDFLKHMIELKTDPMLTKAASRIHRTNSAGSGIGLMIGSHVWHAHLIDSVSDLMDDQGKGFSYVDLVMHSWLKTVFRKADWMWHNGYVHIVDHLCKLTFVLYRHSLVYHMLIEEHKRMEATKIQQSTSSPRLTRFIKNMVVSDGGPYASLLNGEWSMLKPTKGPGVEQNCHWFAFQVLVLETISEAPFRQELCGLITKQLCTSLASDPEQQQQKSTIDLASLYKLTSQKKPIDYLAIYRWVQHIMTMPVDHPLLPLCLQMFFSLYYLNIHDEVTLGFVCFHKKTEWTTKLRDYIASVQTHYGQKITTTTPALAANYDDEDCSLEEQGNSGHTAASAEVLQQFYYAMWLWLGNADLNNGLVDAIHHLPSHYHVHRLKLCYGKKTESDQPWHHTEDYWMDLVDTEQLEQDFMNFGWEGSEKFRTDGDAVACMPATSSITTADDVLSLSTTTRRLRLITDESTIEPLPPLVINTPSTSTSTSSIKKRMNLK
ncbi:hypothetical protein MAM1_0284c09223 [Mucor ambiguus]|uniref:Epg5-like TPR domain-containing protein n=1 Tax=Mucor ambiguus TaxID=91626 RepID=A0A0C9MG57_9FUNG|nr:hypothetical protein MAM1_0284c09223 [Mucor ambiguus]